jgi:hypothetical protein
MKNITNKRLATVAIANNVNGVKNGALYSYRGQVVRAISKCSNGLRLVGSHNTLFGFVRDRDLKKINTNSVNNYLSQS